jgi:acyl-CoA synthetase (NDP forming)
VHGESNSQKFRELDQIFYPRSVAVVGVSMDEQKIGSRWMKGFLTDRFKGPVYGVNPSGGKVFDLDIYPNLRSIPGPVDLVVACIPRALVLDLLDDCAAKEIKAIQFFTAGFRETGDEEWAEFEHEMVRRAQRGRFRIVGPNCFGLYCPEHGVPYGPWIPSGKTGSVGYISQSGGHAGKMLEIGLTRGISFSKVVSMGNGSDLGSADYLEYLAADPKTGIIGMYLEGPPDSRRLFEAIKVASQKKPVVVWKGGNTEAGARATASHTGALASSGSVWSAALKQAGAVEAHNLDELADTILLLQNVGRLYKSNIGIVCGLIDGGGGEAVLTGDACASLGMNVPTFTEKTSKALLDLLGQVGSVLRNPVDISQRYGDPGILRQTMELMTADPHIDLLVVYENADILSRFLPADIVDELNTVIISFGLRRAKPVVVVLPPGSMETRRLEIESRLGRDGVPVYPSIDRAAKAIYNISRHSVHGSTATPQEQV